MKRKSFIGLAALAAAFPPAPVKPQENTPVRSGRKALILVGGADRGAYEAGAIQALTQVQGVGDGQPLGFDMVCGTSIGALNGFMVATAQYKTLQRLWRSVIPSRDVFRLKKQFNAIQEPESGILDRLAAAFTLSSGLVKNVTGILDPAPVRELLAEYVDPDAPSYLPFYISTTNITRQTHELFVRRATTASGRAKQSVNDALLASSSENMRIADDLLLRNVLFASAAIPVLFDPILIPREHDPQTLDAYVDGGVTQNVPLDVALLCADSLNVILVSPARVDVNEAYSSALDIGLGTFYTMQARILAYQIRLAYALGEAKLPFTAYEIRPARELPGGGADFSNQAVRETMWQLGFQDMVRGWVSFTPPANLPFDSTF